MAIKSLTCSRKVADLLNRLGYVASYSTIEELETKLTFEATKEKRLIPDGMSLNPDNNIAVAFDNFDRYVEIVSGKDTLRDIVYIADETSSSAAEESIDFQAEEDQEIEVSTHVDHKSLVFTSDGSQNKKRRRKFETTGLDIEPYRKNPAMLFSDIIPQSDVVQNEVPTSLFYAKVSDFL